MYQNKLESPKKLNRSKSPGQVLKRSISCVSSSSPVAKKSCIIKSGRTENIKRSVSCNMFVRTRKTKHGSDPREQSRATSEVTIELTRLKTELSLQERGAKVGAREVGAGHALHTRLQG